MRTTRMFTILVLTLGLMVWSAAVSNAAPMGTAWTYQGRLMDDNIPADGRYDLQFALFTDPMLSGSQIGPTVDINDLDVIDGYFTVELDFGSSVFNGDARWLEIGIRPWDSEERHTLLSPRQEVTPTPYALQTRGIFVDDSSNVGIGTTNPNKKLTVAGGGLGVYPGLVTEPVIITDGYNVKLGDPDGIGNQVFLEIDDPCNKFVFNNGNVGIGTSEPEERLHVEGNAKMAGSLLALNGISGYGDRTTGNNIGVVGWTWTPTTGANFAVMGHASNTLGPAYAGYFTGDVYASGKVGIGTASPVSKLDVAEGCITGSMCSDIRLKKNIKTLPDDSILDRVMGLQAVTFEWKNRDDGKRQIGLIAQDVEVLFPEVVTTPDDDSCEKGLLATGMDAVLIEAIKELKVENELLKDRIEALERSVQQQQVIELK